MRAVLVLASAAVTTKISVAITISTAMRVLIVLVWPATASAGEGVPGSAAVSAPVGLATETTGAQRRSTQRWLVQATAMTTAYRASFTSSSRPYSVAGKAGSVPTSRQ